MASILSHLSWLAWPLRPRPSLPDADRRPGSRRAGLENRQLGYRYVHDRVAALPFAERVPFRDGFRARWFGQMTVATASIVRNARGAPHAEQRWARLWRPEPTRPGGGDDRRDDGTPATPTRTSPRRSAPRTRHGRTVVVSWLFDGLANRIHGPPFSAVERRPGDPPSPRGFRHVDRLEDYRRVFSAIPMPRVGEDGAFEDDAHFARMRVAGPNPFRIRALDAALLAELRSGPEWASHPPEDADLAPVGARARQLARLAKSGADNPLFVADYRALEGAEAGHAGKRVHGPVALFGVPRDSGTLVPLAIWWAGRKDRPAGHNGDGHVPWKMAKTAVSSADAIFHEGFEHIGRAHLWMEPVVLATKRQLSRRHPVHILLDPHFYETLAVNDVAQAGLLQPGGAVESLFGTALRESHRLAQLGFQVPFERAQLPLDLRARGVERDGSRLGDYPFRDRALPLWDAIHAWCTDYVALYYRDDATVRDDPELAAWVAELGCPRRGKMTGVVPGGGQRLERRAELADVLAAIVFTASVRHAALNFPQLPYLGYAPNLPLAFYADEGFDPARATEADYLRALPPPNQAARQLYLGFSLSKVYAPSLVDAYPPGYFRDPAVRAPLARFREALDAEERARRPSDDPADYDFLRPSRIPRSINI